MLHSAKNDFLPKKQAPQKMNNNSMLRQNIRLFSIDTYIECFPA
jgi:hypothetical protein